MRHREVSLKRAEDVPTCLVDPIGVSDIDRYNRGAGASVPGAFTAIADERR